MPDLPTPDKRGTSAGEGFVSAFSAGPASGADTPRMAWRRAGALGACGAAAGGVAVLVVVAVSLIGQAPAANTGEVAAISTAGAAQGSNPTPSGTTGASDAPASSAAKTGSGSAGSGSGKAAGSGSGSGSGSSSGSSTAGGSGSGTGSGTGGAGGGAVGSGATVAPQSSPQATTAGSGSGTSSTGGAAVSPTSAGATTSAGTTAAAVPKPTYSAVAGLDCTGSSTATYSDSEGYYTDGDSGWLRPTDGYAGSGCTGKYDAVPMSGTAGLTNYDSTGFALYKWNFSGSFTDATCQISVFVPDDTSHLHVGGNPTYYYYYAQNYSYNESMTPTGNFSVAEVDDLGEWVAQSPFSVSTGYVTLKLLNSGQDWTSAGVDYAHHAAAAVKLSCTES